MGTRLFLMITAAFVLGFALQATADGANEVTLYVSPNGNDAWSGAPAAPEDSGADGPLATIQGARDAVRRLKTAKGLSGPVHVLVRDGTYRVTAPLVFGPEDSGTYQSPITYMAYPGERPVISGGRLVTGWKRQGELWTVSLPEVKAGKWCFSALWVNGERRTVARTPNEGYLYTRNPIPPGADPGTTGYRDLGNHGFYFAPGDVRRWDNLEDALFVAYQSWETSMHRVKELNEEERYVDFTGGALFFPFEYSNPCQRYRVENVFEALDSPGEWYLNRRTGTLYYRPVHGEDMAQVEVIAPVAGQLVVLSGGDGDDAFVEHVHFRGLRFHHTDYTVGPKGLSDPQAAQSVPGAIHAERSRYCSVTDCEIAHVGTYGIYYAGGCLDNRVSHCEIHDLGAGGVRIGNTEGPNRGLTLRNVVDNNFIYDGGNIFPSGVGVFIARAAHNTVSHNEICDFYYTGVSVGWSWGYGTHAAHHNIIEYNHIHHIGQGVLSDMGGIYTLGVQPGTILRNNVIHDVLGYAGYAWGIYLDEGSSDILVENNLTYNTDTGGFNIHYGKENRVRNNIFALARTDQLFLGRIEEHVGVIFERNIVLLDGERLCSATWVEAPQLANLNCYWDLSGKPLSFSGQTFAQRQAMGRDTQSIVADPRFKDPKTHDFRVKADSPALALGFAPIDVTAAGLIGEKEWVEAPTRLSWDPPIIPPEPLLSEPFPIEDGYETTSVGGRPVLAQTFESETAPVRVSDDTAASGKHSLKFTDGDPARFIHEPEVMYHVKLDEGIVVCAFDVRLEPGAILRCDLRGRKNVMAIGAMLVFTADGRLEVNNKALTDVPRGQWFHVAVTVGVGDAADGTLDLAVTLPDGAQRLFDDIPYLSGDFDALVKVSFLSFAKDKTVFYLDNVSIKPRPPR